MKVLVTGASGFLGSHVAEQLKEQGHDVRCLVRKSSKTKFLDTLGVEYAYGAIDDAASLPDAVRGVDAIVHAAGVVKADSEEGFIRVNAEGSRALVAAAEKHAKGLRRFVHVSTAGVHGPGKPGVRVRASDAMNPVTGYSRSKLEGERRIMAFADRVPITILRPPPIYGPRDTEIFKLFQILSYGMALRFGRAMESVSMIYGPDAADACIKAITADVPSGTAFLIDDGGAWHFDQLIDEAAKGLGVDPWLRTSVPEPVFRFAAAASEGVGRLLGKVMIFNREKANELLIEHFLVHSDDARAALGWSPKVQYPEGAKRTADWYRANRWL